MKLLDIKKPVHLLYVPTIYCNMGCKYCYLGTDTNLKKEEDMSLSTLKTSVEKFLKNGYLPFNISFHGGEVTTLSKKALSDLFDYTKEYYEKYATDLKKIGFKKKPLHIKTNLLNFDKHYDLLDSYGVSISGSVDLPLRLHAKYRTTKNDKSTLKPILKNLKLLATYKHNKKISCVVTKEHLGCMDEFIKDIKYLHYDVKLDMTKFNVMFGFESVKNKEKFNETVSGTEMLTQDEQVVFYNRLKEEFVGTELEEGFNNYWFEEFTPAFCCNAVNCGDKMFLLQSDGKVFSCPRGQSSSSYYYGNILRVDVEKIIANGIKQIQVNENTMDINANCLKCEYLPYCNIGCTFVRQEGLLNKSYTCKLQKVLYEADPVKYPKFSKKIIDSHAQKLIMENNIKTFEKNENNEKKNFVTSELFEDEMKLNNLIKNDEILMELYSDTNFKLSIDNELISLESQLLKNERDMSLLNSKSKVLLHVHKNIFKHNCKNEEVGNNITLFFLRDTNVTYGEEKRTKQEHLFDYSIYSNSLKENSVELVDEYFVYDISKIFRLHSELFLDGVLNNLFFTTKKLREYHYAKHKSNAFYHIQAINLPFQNFEFYWEK